MTITYNADRDLLEVHWSTDEPGEWRRARANVDLLVSEANETLGVAISAASWLCPQLRDVHHDLYQILPIASWPAYRRPAPSLLRGLGRDRNVQPQLDWDTVVQPQPKRKQRGICQHCGAIATDRRQPTKRAGDAWPFLSTCRECFADYQPIAIDTTPPHTEELLSPRPWSTPNPHTGPRGRGDRSCLGNHQPAPPAGTSSEPMPTAWPVASSTTPSLPSATTNPWRAGTAEPELELCTMSDAPAPLLRDRESTL